MKTIPLCSFMPLKRGLFLAAALAPAALNLILPTKVVAQIYTGDLELTTQAAVNAFNYIEVTGNILIGGGSSDISDLSPLSRLTRVGGNLIFQSNEPLANVDGLASLHSVGGDLRFLNNLSLTDVDGLAALTTVGGTLYFFNQPSLTSLYGLSSLATVGGSVGFAYSVGVGIKGTTSLTAIGGDLSFTEVAFENLDGLFPRLTTIGGGLGITHCFALRDLNGLSVLTSVGRSVFIRDSVVLENVDGLASLTMVGGVLSVSLNPKLANMNGLSALSSVGGDVSIDENRLLDKFCGLWSLLSTGGVGGEVTITSNKFNPSVGEIIAAGPCDADGDGVPDDQDACASSDLRPTVWVLNCDSGVQNRVGSNGCSLADRVAAVIAESSINARNHGKFVSRTASALNVLVTEGLLNDNEHKSLMRCVGSSAQSK